MTALARFSLALAAGTFVVAACRGDSSPTTPPDVTLEELYGRMAAAMTREGQVFHVTVSMRGEDRAAWEVWIDLPGERGYLEARSPDDVQRTLVVGGLSYRDYGGPGAEGFAADSCYGSPSPVLSLLLMCHSRVSPSTTTLDGVREIGGRRAYVIRSREDYSDSDTRRTWDQELYVDTETYFPFHVSGTGTSGEQADRRFEFKLDYRSEFVDISKLAADFFRPARFGWDEAEPPQ